MFNYDGQYAKRLYLFTHHCYALKINSTDLLSIA